MRKPAPSVSDLHGLFQPWEIAVATKVIDDIRQSCKCLQFEDFDELLQISFLKWLEKRASYNPAKNCKPQTFMARVIRNMLLDVAEKLTAKKRAPDGEHEYSFDKPLKDEDGDPITLEDVITDGSATRRHLAHELRIDIRIAMKTLTPRQRAVCRLFYASIPLVDASRLLNMPTATLHDEIMRIRKVFEAHGLDGF